MSDGVNMEDYIKEYDLNHEFKLLEVKNDVEKSKIILGKEILNEYFKGNLYEGKSFEVNELEFPDKKHYLEVYRITENKICLYFYKFFDIKDTDLNHKILFKKHEKKIKGPIEQGFIKIPTNTEKLK